MNIKLLIIAVVVSLVAAAPITAALDKHTDSLKIERSEKQQLQLRLDSIENKLEKEKTKRQNKENKLQNKQQENQELKQDKQRLRRKLQTKREREERQRLAALREQEEQQQPEPEPEPVTTTHAVGCENYRSAVSQYEWDTDTMMRIMSAESGCNPTNHNYQDNHGSCMGSYGLFQIGCVHGYSVAHLENPSNNIAAAYQIWQSSGYSAWTTY